MSNTTMTQKTPSIKRAQTAAKKGQSSKAILATVVDRGPEYSKMLNRETWLYIFSFLSAKSLCSVAQVSKEWNEMSEEDWLWARICLNYVMAGGDLFASEGYSKRQHEIETVMQQRGGGISSHKEMLRKKFDTVTYYDRELRTQPSWSVFGKKSDVKAMLLGLDNAGKTTVLYQLQMGEVVKTIPTVGHYVEDISVSGVTVHVWDVGGKKPLRPLWETYSTEGEDADVLIWVVDCHARDRLDESRDELHKFLTNLVESPSGKLYEVRALLVIANKSKKNGKIDAKTVAERLELGKLKCFTDEKKRREWLVMPCWRFEKDAEQSPEAKLGEANLWKGLKWLIHVGHIAAPSNGGVMGFLSNLTG